MGVEVALASNNYLTLQPDGTIKSLGSNEDTAITQLTAMSNGRGDSKPYDSQEFLILKQTAKGPSLIIKAKSLDAVKRVVTGALEIDKAGRYIIAASDRIISNMILYRKLLNYSYVSEKGFEIDLRNPGDLDFAKAGDLYSQYPSESNDFLFCVHHIYKDASVKSYLKITSKDSKKCLCWKLEDQKRLSFEKPTDTLERAKQNDLDSDNWRIDWESGKWISETSQSGVINTSVFAQKGIPESIDTMKHEGFIDAEDKTAGIISVVDSGSIDFGIQQFLSHEYFLKGSALNFRIILRRITVGTEALKSFYKLCKPIIGYQAFDAMLEQREREEGLASTFDKETLYSETGVSSLYDLLGTISGYVDRRLGSNTIQFEMWFQKQEITELTLDVLESKLFSFLRKEQALPSCNHIRGPLWLAVKPIDQMPSILTQSVIDKEYTTPLGVSALPSEIKKRIPEGYEYWRLSGSEQLDIRKRLLDLIKNREIDLRISGNITK